MRTSLRSSSLLAVLSATLAATPQARAGTYTFLGTSNAFWNNASNWKDALLPTGSADYSDEVSLGTSTATGLLKSNMNYGFTRLRKLSFDQKGGAELTGNGIRVAGNGTIDAGAAAHSMSNALVLNDNDSLFNTLNVNVAASGTLTATGIWSGNGTLVKSGAGTLFLIASNTYSSGTVLKEGTIRIGKDDALANGDLVLSGGNLNTNGYSVGVRNLSLGDRRAASVGDVSGTGNVSLSGSVMFQGAPSKGTASAQIGGNIKLLAGQHTFGDGGNRSSGYYEMIFSGAISGVGGLDKEGVSNMVVTGKSSYEGATNVNGGVLFVGATDALPTNTALTIGANGYLSLRTYEAQAGVVAGSYAQTVGSLSGSGIVDLGGSALTVGALNKDSGFTGAIGDFGYGGRLIKVGTGTLTLSGLNSYTGGTTLKAGTIELGSNTALGGAYNVASGDFVLAGGRLELNGFSPTVSNLLLGDGATTDIGSISGAGTVNLTGNLMFQGRAGTATNVAKLGTNLALSSGQHDFGGNGHSALQFYDTILSGTISGVGGLNKTGSGYNLILTGKNTYAGATNVNAGVLYVGSVDALPTNTALSVASGAVLLLRPAVGVAGSVTPGDYSQTVGSLSGAGQVTLGGAILTVGGLNTNTTFSGSLIGAGGQLVKTGTGDLTLSGSNSYSGGTTIKGGSIRVGGNAALGGGDFTLLGGDLELNGFSPTIKNLTVGDGSTVGHVGSVTGGGTLNLNGGIAFNGAPNGTTDPLLIGSNLALAAGQHTFAGKAMSARGSYDAILSGVLSGTGGIDLTGGLTLALTGKSTYSGATSIGSYYNTIYVATDDALPTNTALSLDGYEGILSLNPLATQNGVVAGSYSQTLGSLSGSGRIVLGPDSILTVGTLNADTAFSGTIEPNFGNDGRIGSVRKVGTGTLSLSGFNQYAKMTIEGGTIAANSGDAINGVVAVNSAGALRIGANGIELFDLTGTGTGTVDLGTSSLGVGAEGRATAFNGKIIGSGVLRKFSFGRYDLTGADFSGFTGKLQIDGGTSPFSNGSIAATTAYGGPVVLNGGTLEISQNTAGTLTSAITGTGNFLKTGSGVVKVGDLNITGTTTLAGGGLTVKSGSTFLSGGGFSIASGATMRLSSSDTSLIGSKVANAGTLAGSGEIDASLTNAATGKVQVGPSDRLYVDRATTNAGSFQLDGGQLEFGSTLINAASSFVTGRGVLSATSIAQSGTMAFTGTTDLHGDVTLLTGAKVQTSGGATLTFWDDVMHNGAEIRTNAGAHTTFKGSVGGAGAYTGLGTVEFDGDLHPGNSPATLSFDGDLVLGESNTLTMELGGMAPGTGYDRVVIGRTAYLGGILSVVEYGGFHVQAGQSFDLFDGALVGTFSSISLPATALGWDTSALYTTGVIRAVPEPASLAALAVGALGLLRRRRR